jgi:hypothetical protein
MTRALLCLLALLAGMSAPRALHAQQVPNPI